MKNFTAQIDALSFGGDGVGSILDGEDVGKRIFVPFTAPGDKISGIIEVDKKRYAKGVITSLLQDNPNRVTPLCPYFGECGGCLLQHINYEAQIHYKNELIQQTFRAGGISSEIIDKVSPLIKSTPYGWRRRTSLHCDSDGNFGFFVSGTHQVLPIRSCDVLLPELASVLPHLQEVVGAYLKGKEIVVHLSYGQGGSAIVIELNFDNARSFVPPLLLAASKLFSGVLIKERGEEIGSYGISLLELPLNKNLILNVPLGAFSQGNWEINKLLVSTLEKWCEELNISTAVDLYAGAGNLSLSLARKGISIMAVEVVPQLVAAADKTATKYGFHNFKSINTSVNLFLKNNKEKFDLIIADPPRSGLQDLALKLPESKYLIHISCYLPKLVSDLHALTNDGWHVEKLLPYDMFPQTTYVEVMTLFSKEQKKPTSKSSTRG